MADELTIDFDPNHTLGFLQTDWIEQHCLVPGGVFEGEEFVLNGWQLYCTVTHARIRPDAVYDPSRLAAPFYYRRSVVVGPQKSGKSPWGAATVLVEAVGPSTFAGWATGDEVYRCSENHCGCGWEYFYQPGEAMGLPRRKALVALVALAEAQTANVFEPLRSMILTGPLQEFMKVRGNFVRLPNEGEIQAVTSKAGTKLGRPYTFALGDESGLYTAGNKVLNAWQTIRRGVTGMQGRTMELTNAWDPMDNSAAQQAAESRTGDINFYYQKPPAELDYKRKADRRKIHRLVYKDSPWVDPSLIDKEADELVETDPTQAERFFGNRLVQGLGSFLTEELWEKRFAEVASTERRICLGFDGSRSDDWTALRAETIDGYRFTPTYGPDKRPTFWDPAEWGGEIPRGEVAAAVDEVMRTYKVDRMYVDPRHWETQADAWALEFGEKKVIPWYTNRITQMHEALTRYLTDLSEGSTNHDQDKTAQLHALAARKVAKPGDRYVLGKHSEKQKIDILMADILGHEAAADARKHGWANRGPARIYTGRSTRRASVTGRR